MFAYRRTKMEQCMLCLLLIFSYITITFAVQTAVIIGLRQSYYSTAEGQGPVEVCVEVLAGDISGNSYIISYSTRGGLAEGKLCNCITA